MNTSYVCRLHQAIDRKKSPLVVGLDPRLDRFPAPLLEAARARHGESPAWVRAALERFCLGVLDAVADHAPAVKINIAFFEQYHVPGILAYATAVAEARRRGLLVIGDVKRADIGSTAEAYAAGHLGPGLTADDREEAPGFTVDAVTLNPYLGRDGIAPFMDAAVKNKRGLYVLVQTSNPSSVEVQHLTTACPEPSAEGGDATVAERVADLVRGWGEEAGIENGWAPVGAVVGATFPEQLAALRERMPHTPLLVPGYGAQGGSAEDVRAAFDAAGHGALINASRSVIYAYANRPGSSDRWEEAVEAAAREAAAELEAVRHGSA